MEFIGTHVKYICEEVLHGLYSWCAGQCISSALVAMLQGIASMQTATADMVKATLQAHVPAPPLSPLVLLNSLQSLQLCLISTNGHQPNQLQACKSIMSFMARQNSTPSGGLCTCCYGFTAGVGALRFAATTV